MTAVLAIGRVTVRGLLPGRRIIGLGLVAIVPALILFLATGSQTDARAAEQAANLATTLLLGISMPVIALILSTSALGDEKDQDTLSFLAVRPIQRVAIAGAKLVAAWFVVFELLGFGALLMGVATGLVANEWGLIIPLLVASAIGALGYVAIFVPFGFVAKRATLIGLIYVFLWELSITSGLTGLAPSSIWKITLTAFFDMAPVDVGEVVTLIGDMAPGVGGAVAKMGILALLSLGVTTALLRYRDIT